MTALAKIDETQSAAPPSLLEIISRAASDPAVDVSKLERLMVMAREVRLEDAKAAYTKALVKMKPLLPVIDRKGRIEVRAKGASGQRDGEITQNTPFARWEDIDAAITPILEAHGFVLTHRTGSLPDGKITVTAVLSHEAGHSEETTLALPHDSSGSKNPVQAVGSTLSYGKRYTASLLLNIRTKGEDDDGRAGGDPGTISETQAGQLLELLTRDGADVPLFCEYMAKLTKAPISSLLDIPGAEYTRAIEVINTRSQKVKTKASASNPSAKITA